MSDVTKNIEKCSLPGRLLLSYKVEWKSVCGQTQCFFAPFLDVKVG
jgi:hypothetical protein